MRLRARLRLLVPFASLLVAAIGAPVSAFADEAYVCEGGRIVYVAFGDLERLKRTDACIAAHYGLQVAPTAPVAEAGAAKSSNGKARGKQAKANAAATMPVATAPSNLASDATPSDAAAPIATAPIATAPVATAPVAAHPAGPAQRASRASRPGRPGQPAITGAVSLPVRSIAVRRVVEEGRPPREITAAPSTDYRNVRILNATPAAPQWFRHDM